MTGRQNHLLLKAILPTVLITAIFAGSWYARRSATHAVAEQVPPGQYARIVTLAPSLTESVCTLGLQKNLVGVTRYCNYPPEIESLPKIGGYDNPSVEAIARLRPNLVVALQRHSACADTLRQEGIPVLVLQEGGIDNIMANLDILARTTMAGELAENVIADLHRRMETISSRTAGRKRPSVLVSVGRNMGDAGLREVYIAAQEGFYDRMIEIAGGRNACQDTTTTYPRLTPEGVTRLNPDVILDMVDDPYRNGTTPGKIASEWSVCSQVSAVQHRRVHVLSGNHVVVPGPRFILILEQMAGLLHPEIDWSLK